MSEPALGTDRVMQIGIVVRDIEKTAAAWSRILGLPMPEIRTTDPVDKAQTEYEGEPTPARARLAFFHMGQVDIELIEPIDGPSTWKDQLDAGGDSLHHIAFVVDGMGERLAHLAEHDIPLVQRGEYTGGRYAYVDATRQLGTVLELLEND
jgi:catechol 2,3-dioxygenase-like lactoylglutathione lyase family enzyme